MILTAVIGNRPTLKFEETGSWYIQALTESLSECFKTMEILSIMTRVIKKIHAKEWTVLPVHKEWTPISRSTTIRLPSTLSQLNKDCFLDAAAIPLCRLTMHAQPSNEDILNNLLESPREMRKALKPYRAF